MSRPTLDLTLDQLVAYLQEHPGLPTPCPYLPDRTAVMCGFAADSISASTYHTLMDRGFRRSGTYLYQPVCPGCRECVPMRLSVAQFRRSHSQARVWRRNRDITVHEGPAQDSREKWEMFVRYLRHQHDGTMSEKYEDFERYLYESNVVTIEFEYRLGRRLVAVSIADAAPRALSTVYAYFDPQHQARSLGTFSILHEIEFCRRQGIPHYYLGYHVRQCAAMNYKARFQPHELLLDYCHWSAQPKGDGPTRTGDDPGVTPP